MTHAEESPRGFVYASTAFWGLLPIYMKALAHVPPMEVIGHRVIWSLPIAGGVLWATRRVGDLKRALHSPRTLLMGAATAALISINWGIYVWAIGAGHALDAALGYYINPLFSILLGAVLLRERLSPAQALAVALAAGAVLMLTLATGRVPVVALGLTLSFGLYAYLKKSLPIGPNQGFFLEVLLLAPFAAAYLVYLTVTGRDHFLAGDADKHLAPARLRRDHRRAAPVLRERAKLLRLSTIGIMQYIVPTMIFLTAVFVFGEDFGVPRMIAFPMIWAALGIYTVSLVRRARLAKAAGAVPQPGPS